MLYRYFCPAVVLAGLFWFLFVVSVCCFCPSVVSVRLMSLSVGVNGWGNGITPTSYTEYTGQPVGVLLMPQLITPTCAQELTGAQVHVGGQQASDLAQYNCWEVRNPPTGILRTQYPCWGKLITPTDLLHKGQIIPPALTHAGGYSKGELR